MTNKTNIKTSRLERSNWVFAAIEKLRKKGIESVKVEPLAKELGVSRGSFYWHFSKHQDLLDAIIEHWQASSTQNIIADLEASDISPSARLENLMNFAFGVSEKDFSFERAIRDWATKNKKVKNTLAIIDNQRIEYLQKLLEAMDWEKEEAKHHARVIYFTRTGLYFQGNIPNNKDRLDLVEHLLKLVLQ